MSNDDTYTDSAFRAVLSKEIRQTHTIKTMSQQFHIQLHSKHHKKMITQMGTKLLYHTSLAATDAVIRHFTHIKAQKVQTEGYTLVQTESKLFQIGYLENKPPNNVTITIDESLFPHMSLSRLKASHIGKVVQTDVTVIGPSAKKAYLDKVRTSDTVMDYKQYNAKRDGPIMERIHDDTQILLVEEIDSTQKDLRKLAVHIYGEQLVGKFETGDKVRITGIYETVPGGDDDATAADKKDLYIEGINIEKLEERQEYILKQYEISRLKQDAQEPDKYLRNLTKSFAPHIQSNHIPKLGILLTSMISPRAEVRTNLLTLLVGPPGVGKSEMLKATLKLQDSVAYVDAPNVTSRGLTYGQEEYNKTKILRAGVLIRYPLVIIDELDKMPKGQREELNTTTEQQIASYHKTPFDMDTPINVGIIAGANPAGGRWLDDLSITENLKNIEATVQDRYLIIKVSKPEDNNAKYDAMFDAIDSDKESDTPYDENILRGLINHTKTLNPKFTSQSQQMVKDFLNSFASIEQSSKADLVIETRKEFDLIRIIKKMAQLLMREQIDAQCVRLGVDFYKECMASIGMATDVPTAQAMLDKDADPENVFWRLYRELLKQTGQDSVTEYDLKVAMENSKRWPTIEKIERFLEKMKGQYMHTPQIGRLKKS